MTFDQKQKIALFRFHSLARIDTCVNTVLLFCKQQIFKIIKYNSYQFWFIK